MKINSYLTLPYLTLLCLVMLMVSCSKEVETPEMLTPNVTLESTERSCVPDCTQCPQDFCCCLIEVLDPTGMFVQVQFCGNMPGCAGTTVCSISATGNCPEINGRIYLETLDSGTPFFYCQEKDEAIRITNAEPFDVTIRISCFLDDSTPSITNVLIPGFDSKTIFVSNNCEPEECN